MAGRQQQHSPVMLAEATGLLRCRQGGIYVDATVGLGGHAQAILECIRPDGLLVAIDRDGDSLELARHRLAGFWSNVRFFHENFKNLPLILNNLSLGPLDGILLDLGVSSCQLLDQERGFSFQSDAELDMRMDRSQRLTARNLVNELSAEELADILFRFGEERWARRISQAVVRARQRGPITRCSQLAEIISRTVKAGGIHTIHPATRTFQALRIAVNQELEGLGDFVDQSLGFLRPGGRLVVISFHSLEDRIIKRCFRRLSGQCVCDRPRQLCVCPREKLARLVTARALRPSPAELELNPRARSARLRSIERL
jgi:16S rRNA (cytosine1402-N4)-methyltransferase